MKTTPNEQIEYKPKVLPNLEKILDQQEKTFALRCLNFTVENHKDINIKLQAIQFLKNEAYKQARFWARRLVFWEDREKEQISVLIEQYKKDLKTRIIVKYIDQIRAGVLSNEAQEAFKTLDNLTKNACFIVLGAQITHKDCKTCPRQCGKRPETFLVEEKEGEEDDSL